MKITQVETPLKPRKKLLYQHLKPNDTFIMRGDKDVRIRTEEGHIGFHEREYYTGGLKVSVYENEHEYVDTVVRLITTDLQWCEKEDS